MGEGAFPLAECLWKDDIKDGMIDGLWTKKMELESASPFLPFTYLYAVIQIVDHVESSPEHTKGVGAY